MKAEELMIGDWVTYKGEIEQICGVDLEALEFAKENDVKNIKCDYVPIPITEEIIKRNHFLYDGEEYFSFEGLFEVHIIPYFDSFYLSIFHINPDGGVNVDIPVDSVHELQHALRLCKVKKEIEL